MKISFIDALTKQRAIGKGGKIPWIINEDLRFFKNKTNGLALIMGRKTFESIGRPLPNRKNIIMTRMPKNISGVHEVTSKDAAIKLASSFSDEVFVIGGERVYEEFLPLANKMYLTEIDIEVEADTYFPEWQKSDWIEVSREDKEDLKQKIKFSFVEYERRKPL